MTIIAAWSTKEEAVSIVKARVDSGNYTLAEDNDVVWLHPNPYGERTPYSVYDTSTENVIELYAIKVGKFLGYEWAFQQ
jgi:hypothetical protein